MKTGDIFEKWTVIRILTGTQYALCRCKCGTEKKVARHALKMKLTKGCRDCWKNRCNGRIKTPGYKSWRCMKQRCLNPNNKSYSRYGGRGITICQRWIDSFDEFIKDMGTPPDFGEPPSIERINVDGDYEPENCIWIPFSHQCKNRRNVKLSENDKNIIRKSSVDSALLASRFNVSKSQIRRVRSQH